MPTRLEGDRVLVNNRWVHGDGTNLGFLNTGGGWDMYVNNNGQIWTPNYGWLHDAFFSTIANCAGWNYGQAVNVNCYGSGNVTSNCRYELIDNGSQVQLRGVNWLVNCNCNC